jgi:chromosome segregation ATPase
MSVTNVIAGHRFLTTDFTHSCHLKNSRLIKIERHQYTEIRCERQGEKYSVIAQACYFGYHEPTHNRCPKCGGEPGFGAVDLHILYLRKEIKMSTDHVTAELPKVTSKSTRAELLKAYQLALQKLEEASSGGKAPVPEAETEPRLLFTDEEVIKAVNDLQVMFNKALKDLLEKMIAESGKLEEIRKTIERERARLRQVHEIEFHVHSLAALIEAQAERKSAFEKEMAAQREQFEAEMLMKRDAWKREQQLYEQSVKERDSVAKKQREREEEEYRFMIALERKKEAAEHAARRAELERQLADEKKKFEEEITERRKVLAAQEGELVELRKRVEGFPKELEAAVKKAEAAVRQALQQQFDFENKLAAKDIETERRVNALRIASLEEIVAKQQTQIADLTKQLQAATKQVQEMALKAIESTSGKGRVNGDTPADQRKGA